MKRRFIVTADWHFDNFGNLGIANSEQLTPQILFIEKAIYEIKNYMLENEVSTLFVCGDLVHRRNIRQDSVNNLVTKVFKELESVGIETHIIVGNHDQSTQGGQVNAVTRLASDKIHVYSKLCTTKIMGIEFVMCPYMEHRLVVDAINELRKGYSKLPKIFMGHLGISGATIGKFEKKIMEPVLLGELHPEDFLYMYFGHYHHPQQIGENARYTGAPVQHCFGDSGDERGFWDVEILKQENGWKVENQFCAIDSTPKFYQVSIDGFDASDYREIDFVKVTGVSSLERMELQEKYPSLILEGEEIMTSEDEIVLSMSDGWEEWIKTWVDTAESNKRKRRSLIAKGNEIAGKVE